MINSEKLITYILISVLVKRLGADSQDVIETLNNIDLETPDDTEIEQIYDDICGNLFPFVEISVVDERDNVIDQFCAGCYSDVYENLDKMGDHSDLLSEIILLYREKILNMLAGEADDALFDNEIISLFRQLHTGYVLDDGIARLPGVLSRTLSKVQKANMLYLFEDRLWDEGKSDCLKEIEV